MMERCDASFAVSAVRGGGPDWERAVRERMTGPDLLPASEFTQRSAAARSSLVSGPCARRLQKTVIWLRVADLISKSVFVGKKRELN